VGLLLSGGARDRKPGRLLKGVDKGGTGGCEGRGEEGRRGEAITARGREIAKRPLEASTTCCHRCRHHHRRHRVAGIPLYYICIRRHLFLSLTRISQSSIDG